VVLGDIGHPARDEALDEHPHLGDVVGGARLHEARRLPLPVHVLGHEDAERADVVVELARGLLGELAD
jgi:hypothetical protein